MGFDAIALAYVPARLQRRLRRSARVTPRFPHRNLRVLKYLTGTLGVSEEAKKAWCRHWVQEGFGALEAQLARDAETGLFCHGDSPGLADCCLVPQIFNAERFNVDLSPYPTLTGIHARCAQLAAFEAAHPAQQPDSE
jgi:maleylpyruvate isomerase